MNELWWRTWANAIASITINSSRRPTGTAVPDQSNAPTPTNRIAKKKGVACRELACHSPMSGSMARLEVLKGWRRPSIPFAFRESAIRLAAPNNIHSRNVAHLLLISASRPIAPAMGIASGKLA